MTRQKITIVVFILFLAVVFNIERLGLAGNATLRINPILYATLALASVATLLIPALNRLAVAFYMIFWGLVYITARIFLFPDIPAFGGANTFVTITEISLLILGIFLAYQVALRQREFETFVEKVSLPASTTPVLEGEEAAEQVKVEFIRSRRHNRPLALLVVEPSPGSLSAELKRSVQEIQKKMTQRFVVASLAQLITNEARRTDMVINRTENGRFVILCPETGQDGTLRLAERIQMTSMERLGLSVAYGIASFPDEALTYEDLLNKAEFQMEHFIPLQLAPRPVTSGKTGNL
jgi:hypothetical protein